jgi:hypothetical protein
VLQAALVVVALARLRLELHQAVWELPVKVIMVVLGKIAP